MTTAAENANLVKAGDGQLPAAVVRRGINEAQWRTLFNLFPGARPDSVLMVVDYCSARKLDPLKKPCHIVPIRTKVNGEWVTKDVVMPGIYEYRITAQRTGLYLGHTEPEFGPETEFLGVKAPAWCAMTFHRWNDKTQRAVPFPVKVWFAEVCGTSFDKTSKSDYVNERWSRAPIQMLTKCAEAAGLREAFPEEFGGEATAEEMEGQRSTGDMPTVASVELPKPAQRITAAPVDAPPVATVEAETVAPPAESAAEPQKPAEERPAHIGRITDIVPSPDGSVTRVVLDTGFLALTRENGHVSDATDAREMGAIVELVHRAPSDPSKFKPTILEVKPRLDLMEGQQ